jgi:hypothetical protein
MWQNRQNYFIMQFNASSQIIMENIPKVSRIAFEHINGRKDYYFNAGSRRII